MATQAEAIAFINKIAPIIQKEAFSRGYKVPSAMIAQACCESGYGKSYKASFNNYFGLKYRPNRCPSACGTFVDGSQEQNPDGSYRPITDQWFKFRNMEDGVKGYFEFISIPNYDPVRQNITDPVEFITVLGQCKYYTSLTYPTTISRVIQTYNLTKYDKVDSNPVKPEPVQPTPSEPENNNKTKLEVGDKIKLLTDRYYTGKKIPVWVQKSTLYYRGESPNGQIFSTKKSGPITGVVKSGMLEKIN